MTAGAREKKDLVLLLCSNEKSDVERGEKIVCGD
jgi:hypothetical protein